MKRVIIDTDPGIDDAAAILIGLGSPELRVEAVTTVFRNVSLQQCTVNALRIIEAAKRPNIPVYLGSGRPFNFAEPEFASYMHGNDGMGGCSVPAPQLRPQDRNAVMEIVARVLSSPGEIALLALGRLTNLALAISVEPRVAHDVREIVVLGGAVTVTGNASPVANANLWGDPEASDLVYRSGSKIVLVRLDVRNQAEISDEQQTRVWRADTPAARLLESITPFIKRAYA